MDPGRGQVAGGAGADPGTEVALLGPVGVWHAGGWSAPPSSGSRALLAVLALSAGREVRQERLLDIVWARRPAGTAASTVAVAVHRLRRWLQDAVGPAVLVERTSAGYLLRLAGGGTDLARFRRLVAEAAGLSPPAARVDVLAAALGLWRGSAMEDVPAHSVDELAVAQLERERVEAIVAYARAALAAVQPQRALDVLVPLVDRYPFDESAYSILIEALAAAGRQADAFRVFEEVRARLADKLGIDPGSQLREAHLRVLRQQPPPELAVAAELTVADPAPPAGSSLPARLPAPAQLPADVAGFTGRAEQLRQLGGLLARVDEAPAVPISTIGGSAGVGKTALAVHFGHRVRAHFPDGQLYLNLRGYAAGPPVRPIEALARFLRALGVPAHEVPVEVEEAASLYRTLLADRRMLVVLDNAHSAGQVRPLLPGGAACLVLVTSRDRLAGLVAKDGASHLTVGVLPADEAVALLAGMVGRHRVDAEPGAAAELVGICAGLPLALRIAGTHLANCPDVSIGAYVVQLRNGNRLAALRVDGDEEAAVGAAFDLSYRRLRSADRRLFRLLGTVPGPDFTAPAAAAVTGTTTAEAAGSLGRLTGAHLLDRHVSDRYAFHDLLRAYATACARAEEDQSDRTAATGRLLDWYLHAVDAAAALLYPQVPRLPSPPAQTPPVPAGFSDHTGALAWLEGERANLVAAVRHAVDEGHHRSAWQLADGLRGYFRTHRHPVDQYAVARLGATAATTDGDLRAQAATRLGVGNSHHFLNRYPEAKQEYAAALALCRQAGWHDGEAAVLGDLAGVYMELGQLEQCAQQVRLALAVNERSGRRAARAPQLANLGTVLLQLGRLDQARECYAEALVLHRESGARGGQAATLNALGDACHLLGSLAEARVHLAEALTLHRETNDVDGQARSHNLLASVHCDAGDHTAALQHAGEAVRLAEDLNDPRAQTIAWDTMATIRSRQGEHRRAIDDYERSLGIARDIGNRYPEVRILTGLAEAYRHVGWLDHARDCANQAVSVARHCGYRLLEGQPLTALASILIDQTQADKAIEHAQHALAVHGETGQRLQEARTLVVLGHAVGHVRAPAAALPHWRRAHELFSRIGAPEAAGVAELIRECDRAASPSSSA